VGCRPPPRQSPPDDLRIPAITTFRIADGILADAWEIHDAGDMVAQIQA